MKQVYHIGKQQVTLVLFHLIMFISLLGISPNSPAAVAAIASSNNAMPYTPSVNWNS